MQSLGGIGTTDAQQATIEATLRLKDVGEEEACAQAGIVIDLLFNLWEPIQAVSAAGHLDPGSVMMSSSKMGRRSSKCLNMHCYPTAPEHSSLGVRPLCCQQASEGVVSWKNPILTAVTVLFTGASDVRVVAISDLQRGCRRAHRFRHWGS